MTFIPGAVSSDDAVREARVAVLPVGSFEQHGSHLPLTTDTIIASVIAERVAEQYGLLHLAPLTFSCSHEHENFTGTVSISAQTLISLVTDIRASLDRQGISQLVIINGHGGNYVLSNIAQEANVTRPSVGLFPGREDMAASRHASGMVTTTTEDMHGGEWETSILLHACPELVRDGYTDSDHEATVRPYLHLLGMSGYAEAGIIGRPSLATAEKGRLALASLAESFGALLRTLAPEEL